MNSSQHRCMNQAPASENQTQQRSLNSSLEATVGSPWFIWVCFANSTAVSMPNALFGHHKRVAAIPDDAIASAILFCDRMVAKISERRKVLPVTGRIYEKQSTALFCDCTHNSEIRNALF
ncbi:hypothetical protein TNCV_4470161 [Trichonephila clavipes]|nr:hypothetical protein TNCV_4470161 [Trichonephila clavipes]